MKNWIMNFPPWKNKNDDVDAITFRVGCQCHSPDHDLCVWIDIDTDNETKMIITHFNQTTRTKWWKRPTEYTWLNAIINRITGIWELAFKGYIEFHSDFYLNEEALTNLIDELERSKETLEKTRNVNDRSA
jgi:hypothetical protein